MHYFFLYLLAQRNAPANALNADSKGLRFIVKKDISGADTPKGKLIGLLKKFKYDEGYEDPSDEDVQNDYRRLRKLAREVRKIMASEIGIDQPIWGKISNEVRKPFVFMLENKAGAVGFPLYKCEDMWASTVLLRSACNNSS